LGLLKVAFPVSLVADSIGAVVGMLVQMRTMAIAEWYFGEMAGATQMPPGVEIGMKVGGYVGMFFGVGWLLAKAIFYVLGVVYFNKRAVRDAFSAPPTVPAEPPILV